MRAVHWTVWDDAAAQRVRRCAPGFVVLSGVAIGFEIVMGGPMRGPMPLGWAFHVWLIGMALAMLPLSYLMLWHRSEPHYSPLVPLSILAGLLAVAEGVGAEGLHWCSAFAWLGLSAWALWTSMHQAEVETP